MELNTFKAALETAKTKAAEYAATTAEPHWFPCGFVWATYRCRKNAKVSSVLIADGWRWDDYEKAYTKSMGAFTNSQSMNFKTDIADVYLNSLRSSGMDGFSYRDRID